MLSSRGEGVKFNTTIRKSTAFCSFWCVISQSLFIFSFRETKSPWNEYSWLFGLWKEYSSERKVLIPTLPPREAPDRSEPGWNAVSCDWRSRITRVRRSVLDGRACMVVEGHVRPVCRPSTVQSISACVVGDWSLGREWLLVSFHAVRRRLVTAPALYH